jgi:hypothetical protein
MSLIKALKYRRDPEALWHKSGWGPKLTFLASGTHGEPLVLTLRVPLDWETCDVLNMPAEVAATPGSMAQAMASVAKVVDSAGAITVLGMTLPVKREGEPDVNLLATMTIALADAPGPPPESMSGAEVEPVEFRYGGRSAYRGVRIRQEQRRDNVPSQPPIPFLIVQYMLECEHGRLVITFATPQMDVFTRLAGLLDKIAEGVRLEARG